MHGDAVANLVGHSNRTEEKRLIGHVCNIHDPRVSRVYIDCVPRAYDVVNTRDDLETNALVKIEIVSDMHLVIQIIFSKMYVHKEPIYKHL